MHTIVSDRLKKIHISDTPSYVIKCLLHISYGFEIKDVNLIQNSGNEKWINERHKITDSCL